MPGIWEKTKTFVSAHPYAVGIGAGVLVLGYLYYRGSGSASSGAVDTSAAQATAVQSNAQLQGEYLAAQVASNQTNAAAGVQLAQIAAQEDIAKTVVSAQQETTDTANNNAVAIHQIDANAATTIAQQQLTYASQATAQQTQAALAIDQYNAKLATIGAYFQSGGSKSGVKPYELAQYLNNLPAISLPKA